MQGTTLNEKKIRVSKSFTKLGNVVYDSKGNRLPRNSNKNCQQQSHIVIQPNQQQYIYGMLNPQQIYTQPSYQFGGLQQQIPQFQTLVQNPLGSYQIVSGSSTPRQNKHSNRNSQRDEANSKSQSRIKSSQYINQFQVPQNHVALTNINQQAFVPASTVINTAGLPMINTMPQYITNNGMNIGRFGQELVL